MLDVEIDCKAIIIAVYFVMEILTNEGNKNTFGTPEFAEEL